MNLLAAKLYDPATAVSKSTASLLAMTAFDTTNLRLAITVPAHGMVHIRIMGGAITGATTVPTIFLGVMNGATVLARLSPQDFPGTMNAATQSCPLYAEFTITGLTPGAMNLDLAYGVEVVVASTNIKYGGPNDTTTNNAWGGIAFEAWDPQPQTANSTLAVDANGRVDISKVAGTAQTARDLGANLDTTVSSRVATSALPANFSALSISAAGLVDILQTAADKVWSSTTRSLTDKAGFALSAAGVQSIWDALTSALTTAGSIGKRLADDIDATISSRSTYAGGDTAGVTTLLSRVTAVVPVAADYSAARAAKLDNLDVAVSTRGTNSTAPDNAGIAAIKAKTDSLTFTKPGEVDANTQSINDTTITGNGSGGTPFGV